MSLLHSHPLTGEGRALGTGVIKCVERQKTKQKKLIKSCANAFSLCIIIGTRVSLFISSLALMSWLCELVQKQFLEVSASGGM